MTALQTFRNPRHYSPDLARLIAVVTLTAFLAACGSDAGPEIETAHATIEYENKDQAATLLATIDSLGHYVTPLPRIIRVGGDQDLALFEEEYGSNLTLRADFDFGSKDYFVVVENPPCAHLVRREAYVQSNRFIFEASYRYDNDLACPTDMSFTGTLFAVPKAL